jgi:hypothetical protein
MVCMNALYAQSQAFECIHAYEILHAYSHTCMICRYKKTDIHLRRRARYSPSVSNDDLCNRRSNVVVQQQHRAVCPQTCMRPHHEGLNKILVQEHLRKKDHSL